MDKYYITKLDAISLFNGANQEFIYKSERVIRVIEEGETQWQGKLLGPGSSGQQILDS